MEQKSDEKLDKDWLKEFPARVDEVFNDDTKMVRDEWKKKKAYILSGDEETKYPRISFFAHLLPHPGLLTVAFVAVTAMLWGMFIIFQLVYETIHPENSNLWYYRVLKPLVTPDNPVSLIVLLGYIVLAFGFIFLTLYIEERIGERFEIVKGKGSQYENWTWERRWLYPSIWGLISLVAVGAYGVLVASLIASYDVVNAQEFKENFVLISLLSIGISVFMFFIIPVIPLSVFHVWSLVPFGKTLPRRQVLVASLVLFALSSSIALIVSWNAVGQWEGHENWVNRSFVISFVIGLPQFLWYRLFKGTYVSWKNDPAGEEENAEENKPLDTGERKKASRWFIGELVRWGALGFTLFLLCVLLPLLVTEQLIPFVQELWRLFF